MKTRFVFLFCLLPALSVRVSAQWVLASQGWEAAVNGFLEHRGILFEHEDIRPTIWRSTDHGYHWVKSDTGINSGADIRVMGHVDTVLFAANLSGPMFRSTNNGSVWVPMTKFANVNSFACIGLNAFAGTSTGVWRSTDEGISWAQVSNASLSTPAVAALRAVADILYAGTASGIFVSGDLGVNWTLLAGSPAVLTYSSWAAEQSRFALINTSGLHVSTDAGVSWTTFAGVSARSVAIHGSNLFTGGPGALVQHSSDYGATWTDVSDNLPTFEWWLYGEPNINQVYINDGFVLLGSIMTSIYVRPLSEMIDIPVAVQLSSFRFLKGALEWTTLSEIDNYGFYVQYRAEASQTFEDVDGSFVPGHQTTTTPQSYSYRLSGSPGFYRLRQVDLDGTNHFSDEVLVSADQLTGIAVNGQTPITFGLAQNYPNPFNPATAICYQLAGISDVKLEVFDLLGRRVATLVNERKEAGAYTVQWNAGAAPSGAYYCRLTAGSFVQTRRMILLR